MQRCKQFSRLSASRKGDNNETKTEEIYRYVEKRVFIRKVVCVEFGMTMAELKKMLNENKALDMEQSEKLIYMFGAKNMKACIDWEGINVQCPI